MPPTPAPSGFGLRNSWQFRIEVLMLMSNVSPQSVRAIAEEMGVYFCGLDVVEERCGHYV
jgi:hypothetical protein